MRRRYPVYRLALQIILAVLLLAGCSLLPNKTPNDLRYRLLTWLTVKKGQTLPGTNLTYQGSTDRGAQVLVDDQPAQKRRGDSLDWEGSPLPGVTVDLNSRIAWYTDNALYLVAFTRITVENSQPQSATVSASSPIRYTGPVFYTIDAGKTIPGSSVTYEKTTEEGAQFGGLEGYPYRKVGDSIFWEGTLREGVSIRLNLRVLQFDDSRLRVGGLVTLWFGA